MKQMRRAIIREAIQRKSLVIIAGGLGINDPDAQKAPDDLKAKAVKLLAR
jgi:molybdopterin-biosynthesis enzyme MoeA-like protein